LGVGLRIIQASEKSMNSVSLIPLTASPFPFMNYNVQIEQVPGKPSVIVRRRATPQPLSQVIPDAYREVWNAVRAQGSRAPAASKSRAIGQIRVA